MTSSQVTASIHPGAVISGRYRVHHALGKGGMGSVYAVIDSSTERRMALKYLKREAVEEEGPAAALFQREYHTLVHLRHPRVIEVYDYGVEGGRPYYTMELLDGSDLRELAPLPWRRACEVLRDVASSLALLHSRRMLHRDLSPRNVRCTRDGQAKLIDFGTMTPMGVARDVAGTPPYMAPEAVHAQALDARTDLFALGALAYWTLTGYDAYPARDSRELRQLWPRPILPPSALIPEVPEPLDTLVMSLLSLDAQARPRHVAEIIERLTAIAGLQPVEQLDVARAYLTTPTLVGHGDTLGSFHKRLIRAGRGRGSGLVLEGAGGSGRSRLLRTLVLEGKLHGMLVLTAEADDVPPGEAGVARALLESLQQVAPDLALSTFSAHADVLGRVFPELRAQLADPPEPVELAAASFQAAASQSMRDWLIDVAERRPLMVAVDDADRVDDASLVFLALLGGDARHQKMIVASTVEHGSAERRKPLALLAEHAVEVQLARLGEDQTAQLLRSVFGDVPNLQMVSGWVHALSQGLPRTVMELAQYLVDRGIARYERGSWILPASLRDQALPESVEQAVELLVDSLGPQARALAQAMSLVTDHGHLTFDELVRLSGGADEDETYRAIEELIASSVVQATGSAHHLRHHELVRALQQDMQQKRRRVLHLRLASTYAARAALQEQATEALTLSAYHRQQGGDMDACLATLVGLRPAVGTRFGRTPEAIAMYEACLAHADAQGLAPAQRFPLRKSLLQLSAAVDPTLIEHGKPTLDQLIRDSGLAYLDEVDAPDPLIRVRQCVHRARQVHDALPESERGLDPVQAIYELGACSMMLTGAYTVRNDREALMRLPEVIAPLRLTSPIFELMSELMHQAVDGLAGRNVSARRMRTLARLEHPLDGLDESAQEPLRAVVAYWLGMDEASVAKPSCLERAAMLERVPAHAPLGAQVRSVYHLFTGNESDAETYRQRRELLALQTPIADLTMLRGITYEAIGYALCGSVLGLKRVVRAMSEIAERFDAWQADVQLVRALYELVRGEPRSALEELGDAEAGHVRVQALLALGQHNEALTVADDCLRRYERERDHPMHLLPLQAARALSLSAGGEPAAAAMALDGDIERATRDGALGMLPCVMHEARARIAIEMDDRAAFRHHIRKLGATYGRGNSGLRARYEQLGVVARRALMSVPPQRTERVAVDAPETAHTRSELTTAMAPTDRVKRALTLIARRGGSSNGYLFGMQADGLRLQATLGDVPAPEGLEDMLAFYLNAELDSAADVPRSVTGTFESSVDMVAWINDGHSLYYPLLLSCIREQRRVITGIAVLALPVQKEPKVPSDLVSEVSHALLDTGDVIGADAAD